MKKETLSELRAFLNQALSTSNKRKGVQTLYQNMRQHDGHPYLGVDNFSNTFLESQQSDSLVLSDCSASIISREQ